MTIQQEVQKRASYLSNEQAKVILMLFDNFNIENDNSNLEKKSKD